MTTEEIAHYAYEAEAARKGYIPEIRQAMLIEWQMWEEQR